MERLLRFGTSTVPLFLTPLYLWDQCCRCSAAKHKKKKHWQMQPCFQQAHPGLSSKPIPCLLISFWRPGLQGSTDTPHPMYLWVPEACGVQCRFHVNLDLAGLWHMLSPVTSQKLGEQWWSQGTRLPPKENIVYHVFSPLKTQLMLLFIVPESHHFLASRRKCCLECTTRGTC